MDLLKLIPGLYEDETDFVEFLQAIEPVIEATRQEIAGFPLIRRPERAPVQVLPHLLHMLGWSFPWATDEAGQRKLARWLSRIYRQRGTAQGVKNLIRLVTGIECEVRNQERSPTWSPRSAEWYTFEIIPPRVLTPEEEAAVSRCADFMKPAHTHYRILPPADHWELGVSELSINTVLH